MHGTGNRLAALLVGSTLLTAACGDSTPIETGLDTQLGAKHEHPLFGLLQPESGQQLAALESIDRDWQNALTPAILEYLSLARSPALQQRALTLLRKRTGQDHGYDLNAWFAWAWAQNLGLPPVYADFKSGLYSRVDPRFSEYFSATRPASIRLDEVRWGGVVQDGIPPLRQPAMIAAADADYLDDDNVVFGIEVNGDARAYPRRILAWHELVTDTVGGVPVTGVYCTLCGSMILYESTVDGVRYELGTSGFLYRSNKLMYDRATQSLWSTLWGTPAIGPLVGRSIRLPRRSVVTTSWGEWRRRHPATTVLSIDTGYRRDYGEGVAYRNYFATDELMFNTSQTDRRLPNKAEVLGLVFSDGAARPLAIAAAYARRHPLLHERIGERELVVLTDRSGAMRVYGTDGQRFEAWDGDSRLTDAEGRAWTLHEDRLQLIAVDDVSLPRLPSHSAFWFGWYGAYTNTRLLH